MMFWYWWGFSLLCLIIEVIVAPTFFFLLLAAAGLLTGVAVWLVDISLNTQIFIFSILAIASVGIWKRIGKKPVPKTDHPLLNKRGQQYVGRIFTLYEAIENGQGKIKVDDSIWKVDGKDCAVGTKVRVIAVCGTVFDVQIVES